MAYKLQPEDYVASNVIDYAQLVFYRTQVKFLGPIGNARNRFIQYRVLFRPTNYTNNINLKIFESELIKILVGF
jgi:hypothetical protein